MDNRVYYGQYSLKHWVDLILQKNILLPQYQRYFVWNEHKVATLIETFKSKGFVPPITIGAFKDGNVTHNLILDGQQRLTSILLSYLGKYPDHQHYRQLIERLANENDDEEANEDEEIYDNILKWDFSKLTKKGNTKQEILRGLKPGNYKDVNFDVSEIFLKETFLGFAYLVPQTDNQQQQQKYFSSVFRNINIQGETLLPQESRASLYFLGGGMNDFFDPEFIKKFSIKNVSIETKIDFVRFLSLLSQYSKDGNTSKIARGYKPKMEKYYEEYIYSMINSGPSDFFKHKDEIFPDGDYNPRFEILSQSINDLDIPRQLNSIIDVDIYFFGLINLIIFESLSIDISKKDDLMRKIEDKIQLFKSDDNHKKAPSALKYLKDRIDSSIAIYKEYIHE